MSSLFKVREFWSLELNQLVAQAATATSGSSASQAEEAAGSFVGQWGQFNAIGAHSVLVCANLDGFICIVQIPEETQLECSNRKQSTCGEDSNQNQHQNDRQILLASQLGFPIADLKCGYFTSTLKQSIAVLSFDKIVVYHVKRHQPDLVSHVPGFKSSTTNLDEDLLSHEIEEQYRLDLLSTSHELASNLLVLDLGSHQVANEIQGKDLPAGDKQSGDSKSNKLGNRSDAMTQLPQRDLILVQYTNQFFFTIVDHRKVSGHFRVDPSQACAPTRASSAGDDMGTTRGSLMAESEAKVELLAQYLGPMPMAFIHGEKQTSSLVISLSNYTIYSILMEKLLAQAKQNVVKRVARNLLHNYAERPKETSATDSARGFEFVDVDLESVAIWRHELPRLPLQMRSVARQTVQRSHPSSERQSISGGASNLIVMSRYSLDTFSSLGDHLWSQRFEEPLICCFAYTLKALPATASEIQSTIDTADRMLTLLCTDSFAHDKCNLHIFQEDRLVWSALLDAKPVEIWRTELSKTSQVITALTANQNQIIAGYLGTNLSSSDDDEMLQIASDADTCKQSELSLLETLDAPLDGRGNGDSPLDSSLASNKLEIPTQVFDISTKLEASNEWPAVCVESVVSARVRDAYPSGVLRNLTAIIEVDELIAYKSANFRSSVVSPGVLRLELGNYWPDRGEPVRLLGEFTLKCNRATGTEAMDLIDLQSDTQTKHPAESSSGSLLPASLKVTLHFCFDDSRFGSVMQEYSFQLPLNLIGRLAHLDYSSGLNQSLADVLCNLQQYRRANDLLYLQESQEKPSSGPPKEAAPYYLADMFVRTPGNLIEIVGEILESDLICRGLNAESSNTFVADVDSEQKRIDTFENMNLLAQSLDCRLKFKSQYTQRPMSNANRLQHQSSEDRNQMAVMISIALKLPHGRASIPNGARDQNSTVTSNTTLSISQEDQELAETVVVWLHLCDLTALDSVIPEQLVKQHAREWQAFDVDKIASSSPTDKHLEEGPLLVSIECADPIPVIFLQNHLSGRLQRRFAMKYGFPFVLEPFTEKASDAVEIDYLSIMKMNNFIAISSNLHSTLTDTLQSWLLFEAKFNDLKQRLYQESNKLHLAMRSSLSICKRLSNLPEDKQQQFAILTQLTNHYESSLLGILQELEQMKRQEYQYGKFPSAGDIFFMHDNGKDIERWPDYKQVID